MCNIFSHEQIFLMKPKKKALISFPFHWITKYLQDFRLLFLQHTPTMYPFFSLHTRFVMTWQIYPFASICITIINNTAGFEFFLSHIPI